MADDDGTVHLEVGDGVAVVTFDNVASRNAMSWAMLERLAEIWDEIDALDAVEVVILTGASGDFCAGGDLKSLAGEALATATGGGEPMERLLATAFRALQREPRVTKPTISAVEGVAVGGGFELVLSTDIRVVAEDALLSLPEVRRGLFPAAGGVVRSVQQLPYPVAAQMLLTGEPITAQKALAIGLVSEVVAPGTAFERAREIAAAIRSNSPASVRGITSVLRDIVHDAEQGPMAHELHGGMAALASGEAETGLAAFSAKTEAVYR